MIYVKAGTIPYREGANFLAIGALLHKSHGRLIALLGRGTAAGDTLMQCDGWQRVGQAMS